MEENLDTGAIKYDEPYYQPPRIPAFLKVLCILTFIGAGLGILGGLYNLFMYQTTLRSLEMMANNPFGAAFVDYTYYIEVFKKWGLISFILNLAGSGLCLTGALMMWKLKKTGYFIYIAGQIMPFIAAYGLMGGATPGMGMFAGMMVVFQVIGALFPIAFIVMYTLNLKHLK